MRKYRNNRGMTLIEIMVVVVILGMLATVATVSVNASLQGAKVKTTMSDMKAIETALELYKQEHDEYPSKLIDLLKKQKKSPEPYLKGGREKLKDQWKKRFEYKLDNGVYKLTSFGKNKTKGGEDYDKDLEITNGATEK